MVGHDPLAPVSKSDTLILNHVPDFLSNTFRVRGKQMQVKLICSRCYETYKTKKSAIAKMAKIAFAFHPL